MAFFRRTIIFERMLILMLFLALGSGCKSLRSDAPVSSDVVIQDDLKSQRNHLQKVDMSMSGGQVSVFIKTGQKPDYTSIKQDFPLGIAVYLPDTDISPELVMPGRVIDPIQSIRAEYADPAKTTVKVDVLMNQDVAYEVVEEAQGVRVVLHVPPAGKKMVPILEPDIRPSPGETLSAVMPEPPVKPSASSVTAVEFNPDESGFADIQVFTTDPVSHDIAWQADNRLDLILYDTRVPERFQQPMFTGDAGTAVGSILARPDAAREVDARIEIQILEKVPYRMVQEGNWISLRFDPVQPVNAGPDDTSMQPATVQPSIMVQPRIDVIQPAPGGLAAAGTDHSKFSGEKIKLDFYETDIKNVFRILRAVSGLNFAVDKDVQGKVTMTLDKPVPWDQVLDLVLKMNGLGKKLEGDVVRIATIQTLRQEEKDEQDAIAARKKALEQKKSLEPLVTEYIPISYSDAKTEIEPHITGLLTPERGSISVDQRSNMVIVTDTREKVDQIREMVYRLDTVTPQIMIEAKIVEVTKEFSRNIGINWNMSNDPAVTSGFVNDVNVSVNNPLNDGVSTGDFSFFRIFGASQLALNAQLSASEVQGDVRIVSSPRILTLDNKKAKIKQGMEYAYLERDDAGGSSIKFKDIDLLLEVTPHVTPDDRISMRVFLTKNDIAGLTPSGVPTLITNEAETELLVNNNDTVVIGGIVKTSNNKEKSGLPFLTGIPVLGNMLLGKDTKEDTRNELLIFLTPAIVQLEQKRHAAQGTD